MIGKYFNLKKKCSTDSDIASAPSRASEGTPFTYFPAREMGRVSKSLSALALSSATLTHSNQYDIGGTSWGGLPWASTKNQEVCSLLLPSFIFNYLETDE